MISARKKRWYFDVRNSDGRTKSSRVLAGSTIGTVLDKSLRLFMATWKRPPDKIEIKAKDTYTFN